MAKKNWISVFDSELEDGKQNQAEISWDLSASDESFSCSRDRKTGTKHCELDLSFELKSPVINFEQGDVQTKNEFQNANDYSNRYIGSPVIGLNHLKFYKVSPILSQRTDNIFNKQPSPVIERPHLKFYKVSPILSQRTDNIFNKQPSPVIERHRVRLKKRVQSRKNNLISPELFAFENTQHIESESPTFEAASTQATVKIEPFPTQDSSQVVPSDIDNIMLYYEPPKRKKNYKKGGLAYHLHKALKLKKSRAKIWHHEKVNNMENGMEGPDEILEFKVRNHWKQYGNDLLECVEKETDVTISENNSALGDNCDTFLVIAGVDSVLNIDWKEGYVYELYPPYKLDRVMYKNQELVCYCNISKIISKVK